MSLGERREATFVVSLLINKSRLLAKSYVKQEQVHEMPIGLVMNYVVFRKDRLEEARACALERNDAEVAKYIDNMMLGGVQDQYLVGLESMSPFDDIDLAMWTERLGLTWHQQDDCVDFYFPSIDYPRATWLEEALVYDMPASTSQRSLPIWDGYRLVGDKSLRVQVDDLCTRKPEDFPQLAKTVGPENFEAINWDFVLETLPRWRRINLRLVDTEGPLRN